MGCFVYPAGRSLFLTGNPGALIKLARGGGGGGGEIAGQQPLSRRLILRASFLYNRGGRRRNQRVAQTAARSQYLPRHSAASQASSPHARTHITRKRHDGTHHPNHQCWWWHGRLKAKRQPFVASPNQRRRMPGARAVRPGRALKNLVNMCDVAFGCSPCQGSLQHARRTHFSKEMRRTEKKKKPPRNMPCGRVVANPGAVSEYHHT